MVRRLSFIAYKGEIVSNQGCSASCTSGLDHKTDSSSKVSQCFSSWETCQKNRRFVTSEIGKERLQTNDKHLSVVCRRSCGSGCSSLNCIGSITPDSVTTDCFLHWAFMVIGHPEFWNRVFFLYKLCQRNVMVLQLDLQLSCHLLLFIVRWLTRWLLVKWCQPSCTHRVQNNSWLNKVRFEENKSVVFFSWLPDHHWVAVNLWFTHSPHVLYVKTRTAVRACNLVAKQWRHRHGASTNAGWQEIDRIGFEGIGGA